MAEKETKETKQKTPKADKAEKGEKTEKKFQPQHDDGEVLVRIYGYDIPASKNLYTGLTHIKGIAWTLSNAICLKLNYPRNTKIGNLTKSEIAKIEEFLDVIDIPDFMKNRRRDRETGTSTHYYGTDLEMKREFDIKRMKEMRSYKGVRHALKQPVRGQRTRSHFRARKTIAVGKKSKGEKK